MIMTAKQYFLAPLDHKWRKSGYSRYIGLVIVKWENTLTYYNQLKKRWNCIYPEGDSLIDEILGCECYVPSTLEKVESFLGYKLEEATPLEESSANDNNKSLSPSPS